MTCPECGSEETMRDAGLIFCKKCGLELDEYTLSKRRKGRIKVVQLQQVVFETDAKKEMYALKLGLKHNKLAKDWERQLGFTIKDGWLKPELKDKALLLIKKAFSEHGELEESRKRIEQGWQKVNNPYFVEIEKITSHKWPSDTYTCYLSMVAKFGFHNSSKNFIILQHRLPMSNYVIASELFHIFYRDYIERYFAEGYVKEDERLSRIIIPIVLLLHPALSDLFSITFSLDLFQHREEAHKVLNIWGDSEDFKSFLIAVYNAFGVQKKWVSY